MVNDFFIIMPLWIVGGLVISYAYKKIKKPLKKVWTYDEVTKKIQTLRWDYSSKRYFLDSVDHLIENHPRWSLAGMTLLMMLEAFIIYSIIV
jgi:hypothetical protein